MTIEIIKATMPQVWPGVRDGVARWVQAAGGRRPPNLNHRITEQVLWELARLDLLVTPEQNEIVKLAGKWFLSWAGENIEEDGTPEDLALYEAVRKYRE